MAHHLVGASEVAALLGVSRQRVAQLVAGDPSFPPAEAVLAGGTRVWRTEAIHSWMMGQVSRPRRRSTKTGRPGNLESVVRLAARLAIRRGNDVIDVGHLWLAIGHSDAPGLARSVLKSAGASFADLKRALPKPSRRRTVALPPLVPVTPQFRVVVERARNEANLLRDERVTSCHILLALLRDWRRDPVSNYLEGTLGISHDALLTATIESLARSARARHTGRHPRMQK
jgi:hypothetical protein